ncbi:hypothetical protein [Nonomuraea sp. NPDC001831]|uniref:hypothetical protein n=1 Tax=Nonomuraea sp. NPDC001831 TaxID=3364340 RepID=UPI0036B6711F
MGISVMVWTFSGDMEGQSLHPAINALCDRALGLGLPMLGYVDPCDDTIFNRSQMRKVVPELQQLARLVPEDERRAAEEILDLCQLIERKPHRYLLFNGD